MLKSDQKGKSVILYDTSKVKKNEKLVTAKFDFSPLALKILAALITAIKEDDGPDTIYQFRIKQFMDLSNTKDKRMYKEIKSALIEIMEKVIQIEDENRWTGFHILKKPVIEKNSGVIKLKFDEDIFPLLKETKKRYLQYEIKNILPLSSKYAIRLYEILKDIYNKETYNKNLDRVEVELEVSYLREVLLVPENYKYADFKRRVIELAKKQINENTDLLFNYEEKKEGRKVTRLKFYIYENSKPDKKQKYTHFFKTFTDFRHNILKEGEEKVYLLDNDVYEIKNGYLYKNGELLNKEEALNSWRELFKRFDEVKKMNKDEFEEMKSKENKNLLISKLKEAFLGKILSYYDRKEEVEKEAEIWEILDYTEQEGEIKEVKLIVVDENGSDKTFKVSFTYLVNHIKSRS